MTKTKVEKPATISFIRRVVRVVVIIPAILLLCLAILVGVLLVYSPGKPEPFLDESGGELAGSISEKIRVNINGIDQGMFIKSKNKANPVLLILHGGPGMPEYAISRRYPIVLEDYFTVCWWEQRGAGMSYNADISPESMTFEQLISDTLEVTNYLRNRFGQEKIYLMAHSGGSFVGIQAAARAPELYTAYIGVSQISNQFESEQLAYNYMIQQFTRLGDKRMLRKFEKYPITDINTPSYYTMRDAPMHKLGIGTTHNMRSVITGVFLPVMLQKEYTLTEKLNIWRGKFFTTRTADLWRKLVMTDLSNNLRELDIPVYFFHGIYDYTVSYPLAKDYFDKLKAPKKGFYTFEQSAHSPLFEEPDKIKFIFEEDILQGVNNHADKN